MSLIISGSEAEISSCLRRFAAVFIDSIVLGLMAELLNIAFRPEPIYTEAAVIATSPLLDCILIVLYYCFWESSLYQGTPGKQILGIRVVALDGKPLRPIQALARSLARLFAIGWLLALFCRQNRALHDFAAGSVVVRV